MGRGGEAGGGRDDAATERNREKMQERPGQGKEEQDGRGGATEICMRGTFASEPTLLLALFALSPRVTTLLELESEQPERTNSREYRDWRDGKSYASAGQVRIYKINFGFSNFDQQKT